MKVRDLRAEADDSLLHRFYVDVLRPSFDQDELMDAEALARGVRSDDDPSTLASVAVDDDGSVLGGIAAELYESVGVLLLAYLAVRPGMRGRGVGTALATRVVPAWFEDPRVAIAIGEVHDPRFWPEDRADERLRLYDRLGGRVLAVPFVQPALGAGASRVRGFLLLAFHVAARAHVMVDGRDAVSADLLARFVRRYFEQTEGARPPYDAELAGLLELIERDEGIPLLSVADYERVRPLASESA
jgi:GNAT superfamily N-acetyltransferase